MFELKKMEKFANFVLNVPVHFPHFDSFIMNRGHLQTTYVSKRHATPSNSNDRVGAVPT